MHCPKCASQMNKIDDFRFSAEKCSGCNGIWFRDSSHEIAKSLAAAKSIDESNTNAAAAYNLVRDIDCPECKKPMLKMVDRTQQHIELESCHYCDGVFFDAGEFADLTEFTLLERVKKAINAFKSNINA